MAKVIMIQGTMSNAGKSFLAAGLCRIFKQDGFKTAPFKSQNMALNSYITKDGLEMGRAQVMQAEAAGIEPEAAMNPILLKPTSNMGSQLIVNGEVRGNYPAAEYFKMKKSLIPDIMDAYNSLASRYDVIVVEGAGSPAEINLRENDIVNMGLAEMLDASVLLAGDIDRGGVFAQLYGTAALLTEQERKRIRAFVINKFRGDKEILKPGLSMLYERIQIPFAGVIPYMDVDVDDEDSLSERLTGKHGAGPLLDKSGHAAFAKISVIRLPRISNFTDFNALERLPGIALSYVSRPEELVGSDLIIIPGTKNTMGDLKWLRQNGLEAVITRMARKGTPVIGVCGGFQMLGMSLSDPHGVEEGGTMRGMELLPIRTVFAEKKTRTRVTGTARFSENGEPVNIFGYEIHMGETIRDDGRSFSEIHYDNGIAEKMNAEAKVIAGTETGSKTDLDTNANSCAVVPESVCSHSHTADTKEDGCVYKNVFGTYVHGVFDTEDMQNAVRTFLATQKGVRLEDYGNGATFSMAKYKEEQYDKMAKIIRENLDMDMIYRILERKDVR